VRGPAVPYFYPPPPPKEAESNSNRGGMSSYAKSVAPRDVDFDWEIRDAKERAVRLLMLRVEEMVHGVVTETREKGNELEIWQGQGQRYKWGEPRGVRSEKEGSVRSGKSGRASGLFGL
jgi:hypothetical protein